MKRRDFFKRSLPVAAAPFMLGNLPISAFGKSRLMQALMHTDSDDDRILVLIQLNGGNDGLNTIIPINSYDQLMSARPDIMIPENRLLKLEDETGLHPAMNAFKSLFDSDKVGIVRDVGYPNPNFSHFRATDIWTSASSAEEVVTSGWIGRYLHSNHSGFPEGYPNDEFPDPLALTIGAQVSHTCQGPVANMGMAVNDPEAFYQLVDGGTGEAPDTPAGYELQYIRRVMQQTTRYLDTVSTAYSKGSSVSARYPESVDGNSLGEQLQIVSKLISGGLRTKVYVVGIGGFDTHANQVESNEPNEVGTHAGLLRMLSESMAAFQEDMDRAGLADRVIGMTFSEFGRRILGNGSYGSDHGTAAPLFVFGNAVNPMIHGTPTQVPDRVTVEDNLPMQFDFRSVYASLLQDWFNVPSGTVKEIMQGDFQHVPIIGRNNDVTASEEVINPHRSLRLFQNFPNPFESRTTIKFATAKAGRAQMHIFDSQGRRIKQLMDTRVLSGEHSLIFEAPRLPAGNYHCRLQIENEHSVCSMIKV